MLQHGEWKANKAYCLYNREAGFICMKGFLPFPPQELTQNNFYNSQLYAASIHFAFFFLSKLSFLLERVVIFFRGCAQYGVSIFLGTDLNYFFFPRLIPYIRNIFSFFSRAQFLDFETGLDWIVLDYIWPINRYSFFFYFSLLRVKTSLNVTFPRNTNYLLIVKYNCTLQKQCVSRRNSHRFASSTRLGEDQKCAVFLLLKWVDGIQPLLM